MLASEEAVRKFFDVLNSNNIEALRGLMQGVTWRPMVKNLTSAPCYSGDAIIDDFFVPVRGIFAPGDPKVEVVSLVAGETLVAAETPGSGELADGRPYNNRYAWFFTIENGKIVEIREYLDSLYVAGLSD